MLGSTMVSARKPHLVAFSVRLVMQRHFELFLETNGHRVDEEGCRFTVPSPNPEDMFIGLGGGIGKARFLPFCRFETWAKDPVLLTVPFQTSRCRLIRR